MRRKLNWAAQPCAARCRAFHVVHVLGGVCRGPSSLRPCLLFSSLPATSCLRGSPRVKHQPDSILLWAVSLLFLNLLRARLSYSATSRTRPYSADGARPWRRPLTSIPRYSTCVSGLYPPSQAPSPTEEKRVHASEPTKAAIQTQGPWRCHQSSRRRCSRRCWAASRTS